MKIVLVALYLLFILALLAFWCYGAYLAFTASIILGSCLLVTPSLTVVGIIAVLGRPDLCQIIANWLHLPI